MKIFKCYNVLTGLRCTLGLPYFPQNLYTTTQCTARAAFAHETARSFLMKYKVQFFNLLNEPMNKSFPCNTKTPNCAILPQRTMFRYLGSLEGAETWERSASHHQCSLTSSSRLLHTDRNRESTSSIKWYRNLFKCWSHASPVSDLAVGQPYGSSICSIYVYKT